MIIAKCCTPPLTTETSLGLQFTILIECDLIALKTLWMMKLDFLLCFVFLNTTIFLMMFEIASSESWKTLLKV